MSTRRTYGRLSGSAGARRREYILARDPVCTEPGCFMPSAEADHTIPLFQGGPDTVENMAGKCKKHHAEKTARERKIWAARPRKKRKPGITPGWQKMIDSLTQFHEVK